MADSFIKKLAGEAVRMAILADSPLIQNVQGLPERKAEG
jgi:hypothetical protein